MLVLADKPGVRVEEQDWSSLVLEAFLPEGAHTTTRTVFERNSSARTDIVFRSDGFGQTNFDITAPEDGQRRGWVVRLHLRPRQRAASASVDGKDVTFAATHLQAT